MTTGPITTVETAYELKAAAKSSVLLCGPPLAAVGGGPTHMRNLFESPLKGTYDLAYFESGSRGQESPAKDEPLGRKLARLVGSPFVLGWRIARLKPAIVHLNSALDHKGFWRDFVYLLVCKLLRRRVVFQLHGGSIDKLCANRAMLAVVRTAFSMADAVVLLATVERTDFARRGITRGVFVVPNGIDVAQYRRPVSKAHAGRIRRVAYLGRLLAEKGIFESIQAVEMLRAEADFRDLEFLIAGSGPYHEELQRYIARRGIGHFVKLVGPIYDNAKIAFLHDADLFLFPSYHPEGLPYCILESLAAGTPVIASKVAGIPDVVVDGKHGALVATRDPQAVAAAVRQLAHPERLQAMSQDCEVWAVQRLSLERLAAQFNEVYRAAMR